MSDLKRLGMRVCDVLSGSNVRGACVWAGGQTLATLEKELAERNK